MRRVLGVEFINRGARVDQVTPCIIPSGVHAQLKTSRGPLGEATLPNCLISSPTPHLTCHRAPAVLNHLRVACSPRLARLWFSWEKSNGGSVIPTVRPDLSFGVRFFALKKLSKTHLLRSQLVVERYTFEINVVCGVISSAKKFNSHVPNGGES